MEQKKYDFTWLDTINDISEKEWYSCFDQSDVLQNYQLQVATESAGMDAIEYYYLKIVQGREVIAIIPCFTFKASMTVTAPDYLKSVVNQIRKLWKNFLLPEIFVIGTPVAICRDLLGINSNLDDQQIDDLLLATKFEVSDKAKKLLTKFIIVKELLAKDKSKIERLWGDRFTLVESPATTYLVTGNEELGTYQGRLRYSYRRHMKNRLRLFDKAGMRWQRFDSFETYSDQIHALYLQVKRRSKTQFEELTPQFFKEVSQRLSGNTFVLICFDQDTPVAFELICYDKNWMHPLYLGLDYAKRDDASLYFNCIYRVIDEAEKNQYSVIQLGQTSYHVKAGLGAEVSKLYLAINHTNPLLNRLMGKLGHLLFPPTELPKKHRVFKDDEKATQILAGLDVVFAKSDP